MSKNLSIDYVELPAADFAAVEAFYSTVFAWSFESYGPEYHAFKDGSLDGGFYKSSAVSNADNGAALVIFYATDLEAVQDAVWLPQVVPSSSRFSHSQAVDVFSSMIRMEMS